MKRTIKDFNAVAWLSLLGVFLMPLARAQLFECVDANGNKEYTQKCAPGTVTKREVANTEPGSNNEGNALPPKSYKEEEAGFRQRQLERERAEAREAKARAAAAAAIKKCNNAKAHLISTENARRIRGGVDPQTGEIKYLDDTERAAAVQKARDAVAALCKQ